jgi:hypothetical protein
MTKGNITTEWKITREQMIKLLNEDLAGEYQAIIVQEQEHEIDLSAALDINVPLPKRPSDSKTGATK